jgi:hypothetical protein
MPSLFRHDEDNLLWALLFWVEVNEYSKEEHRSADRLLRMCHAWTMYNKFFSPNAICPLGKLSLACLSIDSVHFFLLGATNEEREKMHNKLLQSSDFVAAEVFAEAKEKLLDEMEKAWIRYLKEDVKIFIEYASNILSLSSCNAKIFRLLYRCHMRSVDSPSSTADDIDVVMDEEGEQLIVRRARPWVNRYSY